MKKHAASAPEFVPDRPCDRCLDAADRGVISDEAVMPLDRIPVRNPLARTGWNGYVCHDCGAAETLQTTHESALTFDMARTVIATERLQEIRLPGISQLGFLRRAWPGTLDEHHHWLALHGLQESES